jgi:dihydroorotase
MDLVVEGKVYYKGAFENCCIGIKNGKIVEIKKTLSGEKHINFGNKLILPAGLDIHVHFRDPGMTYKEDFSSGSMSAAFGGISCVFDMPNTIPHTTTLQTVSDKIKTAEQKSFVDFGVFSGVTSENLNLIERLGKISSGFKIYLGNTTLSLLFNKTKLRESLDLIGITGKPVLFHAEDEECLIKHKNNEAGISDHMRFRPTSCEELSIKEIINSSKDLITPIHICHVSSCEGLELLKKRPSNITCGVTPHHSLFSVEKNMSSETLFKVNPPIRTSFDRESLFNALKNGLVDVLESDHAPHTQDEKDVDFDSAPSGLPGVETIYPIFLYLAKKQIITFQRLISLMCAKPANLVGVQKGSIDFGYDADIIVIDLNNESRIKSENLHSKCRWTAFEDWPAIFPEALFIRGEELIQENEIQVKQGFGMFVGA